MKVFLCHQSESKPFVRELAFQMKQVGIDSWVDEADIGPGESIIRRISEGIGQECSALIASVSRKALDSRWVQEELDQGKYAEITRPNFQLIVILLDDVQVSELPDYLHHKKHILWEENRPETDVVPHPGYGQIIRQLFKNSDGLGPDEAAQDANRLLNLFLNVLYACGWQRELVKLLGDGRPLIGGELRRDFSFAAIYAWTKYSAIPVHPLRDVMRDLIAGAIHADVAAKDWGLGFAETDFQELVIGDFRATLDRVADSIGIGETVQGIKKRLDLQRRDDMASLYQIDSLTTKSRLFWSVDVLGQFFRFGLYDAAHDVPPQIADKVAGLLDAMERGRVESWRNGGWPYPAGQA